MLFTGSPMVGFNSFCCQNKFYSTFWNSIFSFQICSIQLKISRLSNSISFQNCKLEHSQAIFFSHFAYICNFLCSTTTFSYYYPPSPLSISYLLHFYHLHYIISQHMPLPLLVPLPSLAVSDAVNVVVLNSFHRRFIQLSICRKYQEI